MTMVLVLAGAWMGVWMEVKVIFRDCLVQSKNKVTKQILYKSNEINFITIFI
jgi:hypothetical protein